mmetsp:Transcript_107714/g.343811  ORF Transcript_107714/g.343811 Transcript_107714/m.343811 type:complete len:208 (-) Transcript_107714:742-1365(-)
MMGPPPVGSSAHTNGQQPFWHLLPRHQLLGASTQLPRQPGPQLSCRGPQSLLGPQPHRRAKPPPMQPPAPRPRPAQHPPAKPQKLRHGLAHPPEVLRAKQCHKVLSPTLPCQGRTPEQRPPNEPLPRPQDRTLPTRKRCQGAETHSGRRPTSRTMGVRGRGTKLRRYGPLSQKTSSTFQPQEARRLHPHAMRNRPCPRRRPERREPS